MVAVFKVNRPRQLSEVVKVELHPDFSRESGTVKAGVAIDLGEVLAKVTADGADKGKLVQFDPAGNNGSEVVAGVSQAIVEPGTNDVPFLVYSARGTVVARSGLRFKAGVSDATKAVAIATLGALGIIVRD